LFFIAGFFVPSSLERKGPRKFMRDRAFRLGLPVLFYMFILGPITEYFFAHSWNSTEPTSFANEWVKHIRNGEFLQENGPLWFCLALLIFSIVYAAIRPMHSGARASDRDRQAPKTESLICFALVMACFTFLVRLFRPSTFLNMHLGDFPQYILLFMAGILAARGQWLGKPWFSLGMRWLAVALPVGFAAWLAILLAGGALQGRRAAFSGGWHWQSAAFDVWESFTCVAICFGLLALFREKFNSQGRPAKFLSNNGFSVYVFHPPVVIMAARILHGISWHPLLKFVLLTGVAAAVSFTLSAAVFRRIP